jgi:hypothetical protein
LAEKGVRFPHTEAVVSALESAEVVLANPLATVTTTALIVRDRHGGAHILVSLQDVSRVKLVKFTYPGLLVIAAAIFLLAAAAHSSKQGNGADLPLAGIGFLFVLGYWISRKAAVAFYASNDPGETIPGTVRQAKAIANAIELARSVLNSDR